MVQLDNNNDCSDQENYVYGRGNPNVGSQKMPWDVFWAPLAIVVLAIVLLMLQYDLSLSGFGDWLVGLFDSQ